MDSMVQSFFEDLPKVPSIDKNLMELQEKISILARCKIVGDVPNYSNEELMYIIEHATEVFEAVDEVKTTFANLDLAKVPQVQRRRYCI